MWWYDGIVQLYLVTFEHDKMWCYISLPFLFSFHIWLGIIYVKYIWKVFYLILNFSLCGGETHLTQECKLPCPTDWSDFHHLYKKVKQKFINNFNHNIFFISLFSSWGDWGLCDTVCGPGLKNRTAKVMF